MPVEVIMPKVDMDMTAGRIVRWHVAEGARVEKDAALFDIETDKATMEVEAPAAGQLRHVRAAAGEDVAVGAAVAWVYADGEPVGPAPDGGAGRVVAAVPFAGPAAQAGAAGRTDAVRATPLARRLAREGGLEIGAVEGSGPSGRITRGDIAAATAASPPAAPAARPRTEGARTPFVLIHGFAADRATWARLEPLLPAGHGVLHLELPGHGRAAAAAGGFADLARTARTAFDRLADGPVHLVGHSLGGAVALALADVRPRRIASLTLIAPAGLGPEIDGAALAGLVRASRPESLAPWLKRLAADPETISWNFVCAAMAARADPGLRAAQAAMADAIFPDGVQAFDMGAALDRIEAPARIVWGRQDAMIPWRHALRAPGRVGLHLYERTGHLPHIERPDEVARVLSEVAQRHAVEA